MTHVEHRMSREEKKLIFASSLGTIFEWYDFYLYGYMAVVIAKHFFSSLDPQFAFILALLSFACGFLFRPIGAIIFGHLGDLIGRKSIFLTTLIMMGIATFLVGVLPGYEQIGISAPILLVLLRIIQGIAMGGEYGGAIIYVAELAPHSHRASYTSWIQIAPCVGYFFSITSIIFFQKLFGEKAFDEWAWRLPFLISLFYLVFSIILRLKMQESKAYQSMKLNGGLSKSPVKETFLVWKNLKWVLVSLFSGILGQTVLIGMSNLYLLYFLTQILNVDSLTANICISIGLLFYFVFILFFAKLSDEIGRRKLIVGGCFLAMISIYPVYLSIAWVVNPQLVRANLSHPVVLLANHENCHIQYKNHKHSNKLSLCDKAKQSLISSGVNYRQKNIEDPTKVYIQIGNTQIPFYSEHGLKKSLKENGYPLMSSELHINYIPLMVLIIYLFVIAAMVLGPLGCFLLELFPTRIRYTGMSFPYHFGNGLFGGFLPAISFSLVAYTGNIFSGLWYGIILSVIAFVVGYFFIPETKNRDIHSQDF